MNIALFSDIHANLPALEAFFKDVDSRTPDTIYCLGDLVGYNIWPNEIVNEIRKRKIPTIAGNYDFGIGRMSDECGCAYKTEPEKDMGKISISFTNSIMKDPERKYLPAIARKLYHCKDIGQPFDFLTWFEYAPENARAFENLVIALRQTEEWLYVDREIDIRLVKA